MPLKACRGYKRYPILFHVNVEVKEKSFNNTCWIFVFYYQVMEIYLVWQRTRINFDDGKYVVQKLQGPCWNLNMLKCWKETYTGFHHHEDSISFQAKFDSHVKKLKAEFEIEQCSNLWQMKQKSWELNILGVTICMFGQEYLFCGQETISGISQL